MKFLMSSNPQNLSAVRPDVTVEAEYGDITVPGTVATLAHHGRNAGNPAPCAAPNGFVVDVEVVGLSHLDLDTVGGCAAILGRKPDAAGFWRLAEFVDIRGPHRLAEAGAEAADVARLHAFWAWSEVNRTYPPRDGGVVDVTAAVLAAVDIVERICVDDAQLLAAGEEFRRAGERLSADSYRGVVGERVILRQNAKFCNHLYTGPTGLVAAAVVAHNPETGAVTVSFADAPSGEGARGIVQGLWGPLAGGHAGIAGSPRDQRMSWEDALAAAEAVIAYLA